MFDLNLLLLNHLDSILILQIIKPESVHKICQIDQQTQINCSQHDITGVVESANSSNHLKPDPLCDNEESDEHMRL